MDDFNLSALVVLAFVAVLQKQLGICWQVVFALGKSLFFGRQYNNDNCTETADWCESLVKGPGTWGLTKIVSYHLLYVKTEMQDKFGYLHQRDIPILEWLSTKSERRHISTRQLEEIETAGNDWPRLIAHSSSMDNLADEIARLAIQVSEVRQAVDLDRQGRNAATLKRIEMTNEHGVLLKELATSNRDVARSLDSAGQKIRNAGKQVAKAWEG